MSADRLVAWGAELRAVHDLLRRGLQAARDSVDGGGTAGPLTAELLLYCRGFCAALAGHHSSEDRTLFPEVLAARPDLEPVIAKLSQDHSTIDHLLSGLEHAVRSGRPRDELVEHLDGIEAVMESHFRYEERQLIEVLNAVPLPGRDRRALFGPLA